MPLRKLYIELTSSCDLDCAVCYRRSWSEAPRDLDRRAFDELAGFASRSASLKTVVLGGIGEPTASPLFTAALEAFSSKEIIVTSNGVRPDELALEGIAAHASVFVVSVDGMHEAYRRLRGAELSDVLGTVRRLSAMKASRGKELPRIEFQFVLSSINEHDLPDVVDLAADYGVDAVAVSSLLPQDEETAPLIMYARTSLEKTRILYEKTRLRAMRRGMKVLLPNAELKTERRCAFAEDEATFVNAAGEVCPCYRFSRDGGEYVFGRKKRVGKAAFGRVGDETLEEIWESERFAAFRRTLQENRYPSCPDCDLLEGCNLTMDTESDCWANVPSCADCLWARGFVRCP